MSILQRVGWISPLFHLFPGPRPRNLPAGLSDPRFLHRRPVLLVKSEVLGSILPLSSGQALRPGSDSRDCQPYPDLQETVPSRLHGQALSNHQVLCRGCSQILPQRGKLPDNLGSPAKSQVPAPGSPWQLPHKQPGSGPLTWGSPIASFQPCSMNAGNPFTAVSAMNGKSRAAGTAHQLGSGNVQTSSQQSASSS